MLTTVSGGQSNYRISASADLPSDPHSRLQVRFGGASNVDRARSLTFLSGRRNEKAAYLEKIWTSEL